MKEQDCKSTWEFGPVPRVTSLHDIPQHRKKVVGIGHYYPHPDINDPTRELRGRFKQSSKGKQDLQ